MNVQSRGATGNISNMNTANAGLFTKLNLSTHPVPIDIDDKDYDRDDTGTRRVSRSRMFPNDGGRCFYIHEQFTRSRFGLQLGRNSSTRWGKQNDPSAFALEQCKLLYTVNCIIFTSIKRAWCSRALRDLISYDQTKDKLLWVTYAIRYILDWWHICSFNKFLDRCCFYRCSFWRRTFSIMIISVITSVNVNTIRSPMPVIMIIITVRSSSCTGTIRMATALTHINKAPIGISWFSQKIELLEYRY